MPDELIDVLANLPAGQSRRLWSIDLQDFRGLLARPRTTYMQPGGAVPPTVTLDAAGAGDGFELLNAGDLAQPVTTWSRGGGSLLINARREPDKAYPVLAGGIAVIGVHGPIFKDPAWARWFGGVSTLVLRRQLALAIEDPDVHGVLLHVDSPGGHVAGVQEAAAAVAATRRKLPVHAYIEDMGCSAAYWIASQAGRVSINPLGLGGNVGCWLAVYDLSRMFTEAGIETHVVTTGPLKAIGVMGSEITDEQLDELQRYTDLIGEAFFADVARGRKLGARKMATIQTGRCFAGDEALQAGVVDAVETVEAAIANLVEVVDARRASRRRSRAMHARIDLAEAEGR